MQSGDNVNLPRPGVRRNFKTMRLELEAFQKHLVEVDSVIGELTRYQSTELESFWFIKRLILKKMDELQNDIRKLEGAERT